jgi:uncharacterized protein YqeY
MNHDICYRCGLPLPFLKELTDEEVINIIERLIAGWTDSFKNYEYNSDEPKENKLRDDVFAILRKAQEK